MTIKSRAQEIFELFESVCPTCEMPAEPYEAGGTKEFVTWQTWVAELPIPFRSWDKDERSDAIGSISFECENGHKHVVEFSRHFDWM